MATKEFYHNIDLLNIGQLLGARVHNVADQTAETALAATLGADNEGLIIYRADTTFIKIWDGSRFVQQAMDVAGDVIFKGIIDASVTLNGQIEAISGYQYVVGTAGTATATGVTFTPSASVEIGDTILFTSATTATVFQRNDDEATETILGNVRLATQAEVNEGIQSTETVTPATLQGKLLVQKYTKQYNAVVNLIASTPFVVNHGLGLINKDSFVVNTMRNGSQISLDIDSVDANSLTLTSLVSLSNVFITVVGAASI